MLKNFMQPGNTSNSRTDSNRTSHSALESAKPAAAPAPVEAPKAEYLEAKKSEPVEDGNKLIVGPNIKLKGSEITDCEILVVEGRVEASMNSRDIRIAEGGVFSGKAEIDVAEVRGTFEGELTARKRLVIYATGRVSGVIRYGAMMIEEGGTISGDVATLSGGASVAKLPEVTAQTTTTEPVQEKASGLEQIHFGSTLARNAAGKRQG
ncbi:MAG: polymer-forming cytoskeletal protein [Thiobacillus sp.]|nr:polymer-forming cytoskeletal protein [Thiobacillus sp.]MDP2057154.1 polymer-forming cytoskeletal protein [Thiobacillus sp.]